MRYQTYSFPNVMTHWLRAGSLALTILVTGTIPSFAQGAPSIWKSPQYQPPAGLSSPGNLSQGGTRAGGAEEISVQRLQALVPQDLNFGVTTEAYPSFFVYVPDLKAVPGVETLEFSLVNDQGMEVYRSSFVVDLEHNIVRIDLPPQAGLEPLTVGKDYIWLLQGFTEDLTLSDSLFAHGWVRRVLPSDSLAESLANATTTVDVAKAYIGEGIWYDAIAKLQEGLSSGTEIASNREQLNTLLKSAGIEDIDVRDLK